MNFPVIPRIFATMTAPKVSRRFHDVLHMIGIWYLFVRLLKRYAAIVKPSRVITLDGIDGGPRREYLFRWHMIPRNRWFNLYLHKFVHGDDERALHDHPWASASLILEGHYIEHTSEWAYEHSPDTSPEGVNAHVAYLERLFSPGDGRFYRDGSVALNRGEFPGQHKFDYWQTFTAGDFRKLRPDHMHMIELFGGNTEPCWTLFMTGSIARRWGFACGGDEGWRDFRKYLEDHPTHADATRGCD